MEKQNMQQKFDSEILKTLVEVQEQTMQSIAAELHDNVGQLLSLTTLTLKSIQLSSPEKAEKKIENSLSLLGKSIKELRELSKLLHGEQLVEGGIGFAIQQEINWLNKTGAYTLCVNNRLLEINSLSKDKDLVILRLLQEVINNIIKHAQATQINIDAYLENDKLHLYIKENGVGFNYDEVKEKKSGMGLNSIHKRVDMINGKLALSSSPNKGTAITIEIPYP
ncbi:sensor histidine kinase [Pedobacter sp. MW01-1-1]